MMQRQPLSTAIFLALLCLSGYTFSTGLGKTFFAEPYSGKKVTEYEILLPVSRGTKKTFSIPSQCAELNAALFAGAGRWGTMVERRLWLKADDDCRYYIFLTQDVRLAPQDFVSDYDFMNADLNDLPIHQTCDEHTYHTNPAACTPASASVPDLDQLLAPAGEHSHEGETQEETCRVTNGIFRGHLVHTTQGLRCIKERKGAGFRILSVDYSNINGDEYQDAILRLIPIGPGTKPVPMILPLTRYQASGSFSIPSGTHFPELGPGNL